MAISWILGTSGTGIAVFRDIGVADIGRPRACQSFRALASSVSQVFTNIEALQAQALTSSCQWHKFKLLVLTDSDVTVPPAHGP
jgi:hypothetical protein